MLLDHHRVHTFGVFKCQEPEASRAACCTVSHHSAFTDLAELAEVILQRLYIGGQFTIKGGIKASFSHQQTLDLTYVQLFPSSNRR